MTIDSSGSGQPATRSFALSFGAASACVTLLFTVGAALALFFVSPARADVSPSEHERLAPVESKYELPREWHWQPPLVTFDHMFMRER